MTEPTFDDLSDFDYWSEHMDASMRDYVQARVNPEMLLGFMQLMRPETEIYEGRVYWADGFTSKNLAEWKESETFRRGGIAAVQALVNHIHVADFFYGLRMRDELTVENWCFVAEAMGPAWMGYVEAKYPDRRFRLKVEGTEFTIWEPDE